MWISKKKYEEIKWMAENNEHDADMFRRLVDSLRGDKIIRYDKFVIMSREAYDIFSNKLWSEENNVKDIQAELEWYKVKYHEMKMDKER